MAQPEIVPSSVANRKRLGAVTPLAEMANPGPPLKTVPVGLAPDPSAEGTVTVSGTTCAPPSKRLETPVPLSANQNGPVGLKEMPQGLTRLGTVMSANPGRSEARFTWP